jgi:hypothetical protein
MAHPPVPLIVQMCVQNVNANEENDGSSIPEIGKVSPYLGLHPAHFSLLQLSSSCVIVVN